MNELQKFYEYLAEEIYVLTQSEEEGASPEEKFTEFVADLLVEAGETADVCICTEIKENAAGNRMHKINAYALSETYETIDLFISIYQTAELVETVDKQSIQTHSNLVTKFLNVALKGDLTTEMEASAPAFDLAQTLSTYCKDIVRVNIFIVTNGTTKADAPQEIKLKNDSILVMYQVWDLERFYQLYSSKNKREAIQIDFQKDFGGAIPCLSMASQNDDYQSYLAIISGNTLASIYHSFGARLLEQNIRSFLQFTGKVNKGIRETIKKEPHMFLAFNNGIASTAEEVELIDLALGGKGIASIKDFQIVNGGQTTASIFHSQKQDNADLSKIFVQVKLTVIKKKEEFSSIVSRIAKYANSQTRVSDVDFSANNPFHIELEKLSRNIWIKDVSNSNIQTRWFYERARGQYKNELNKEGTTPSRKKIFSTKNPKNQLFQKETLAKYYNAWNLLPYFVTRGNQKNFVEFFKNIPIALKETKGLPDSIFFEDIVAMGILFRDAEKMYGIKPNGMGDLRFIVVPYTLSYLNKFTDSKINLFKIWKNQSISEDLKLVIKALLQEINDFLKKEVMQYGGLIAEWAKRPECWALVEKTNFKINVDTLKNDFIDEKTQKRYKKEQTEIEKLEKQKQLDQLKAIPTSLWKKIAEWGKTTQILNHYKLTKLDTIARKCKTKNAIEDADVAIGLEIVSLAFENAPELFENNEEDSIQKESFDIEITNELVDNLFKWSKKGKYNLNNFEFNFVKKIKLKNYEITDYERKLLLVIIQEAMKKGFTS